MILHHDHKLTYNGQATFELPNGMCFDFHPETSLWEDGFQLIAPDGSFTLVLAFLTVDKPAKIFAEEIFEERDIGHMIEPVHEIETIGGLKGYATAFAYTDEMVEEISLDLPGEQHALLNVRFWRRLDRPYDEKLWAQAKAEILASLSSVRNNNEIV